MENKSILMLMSAVIGIIMIGSLVVPIINSAIDDNEKTFINSGTVLLRELGDDETVTGSINAETQSVIINGVQQSIDYFHERSAVIFAENCMIGYGWRSDNSMVLATDYWDGNGASHITGTQNPLSMSFVVNADRSIDLTVTYESGSASVTIPANDWILVKDDNGDLVEVTRYYGGTVYTDSLDNIYAGSWTFVNSYQFGVAGEVATVNGSDATVVWDSTSIADGALAVNIGYTTQKSYVEFTKTDDSIATGNIQTVVVPVSVTALEEAASGLSLLMVIPVLLLVSVLVGVVVAIKTRY